LPACLLPSLPASYAVPPALLRVYVSLPLLLLLLLLVLRPALLPAMCPSCPLPGGAGRLTVQAA